MVEKHTITLENGDEITFEFQRVNFEDGNSIIHYGHEVKEAIVEIFKQISEQAADYEELSLNEATIKNIESFNDTLEEEDERVRKQEKSISHRVKLFLTKRGVKGLDVSIKSPSYKEQYEEYLRKIDDTKKIVESLKKGSIEDAKTRKELSETLIPFLAILNYVINVGREDRTKFEQALIKMQAEIEKLGSDPLLYDEQKLIDAKNDLQLKRQSLELFDDRLNTLEKDLIIYKQNRQTFLLQQTNEFQILLAAEGYLKDVTTVLETQAAIHIFNRKQQRRINVVDKLTQAGNTALQKDAILLQQNVESVGKLSLNQGIYSSTAEALSTSLRESIRLYIEGRAVRQAQIQSDRLALEQINKSLDEDMRDLSLMNGELGLMSSITDEPKKSLDGFQKKLTYKRK